MVEYEIKMVTAPSRDKVKVLGATFEPGIPKRPLGGNWRHKLRNRAEMTQYLKYNERYLYGQTNAYGSEKRHHPA